MTGGAMSSASHTVFLMLLSVSASLAMIAICCWDFWRMSSSVAEKGKEEKLWRRKSWWWRKRNIFNKWYRFFSMLYIILLKNLHIYFRPTFQHFVIPTFQLISKFFELFLFFSLSKKHSSSSTFNIPPSSSYLLLASSLFSSSKL